VLRAFFRCQRRRKNVKQRFYGQALNSTSIPQKSSPKQVHQNEYYFILIITAIANKKIICIFTAITNEKL